MFQNDQYNLSVISRANELPALAQLNKERGESRRTKFCSENSDCRRMECVWFVDVGDLLGALTGPMTWPNASAVEAAHVETWHSRRRPWPTIRRHHGEMIRMDEKTFDLRRAFDRHSSQSAQNT
jgi:hypothetical protein